MAPPDFRPPPRGRLRGTPCRARTLPSAPEALVSILVRSSLGSLCSFALLGLFWHYFDLLLEPLGPQKPCIFIERVIKFKLFAIFSSQTAWEHENHPPKLQIARPSTPKGIPEEPRSAQEHPGRAPRASQNHPWIAWRAPLSVQEVSWGGFGSLGASFWSPRVSL